MKKNIILSAALMFTAYAASAQTTITFDTDDYAKISVYDSWEESPFRAETPVINFDAAVAANPDTGVDETLGTAPNATKNVVKLRRSRHGSNTFGVRIDLKEPIRVTKELQYIHIMAYLKDKPADSRMMVIGLGNRLEESWSWQDGEDEQFWALTTSNIKPKEGWQDVVVSFKGFSYSEAEKPDSGIVIKSLVIVPDVRSPHADTEDWYAYIDEIVIDNTPDKRFSTDKYALTYEKDATQNRTDRKLNGVGLTSDGVSYSSAATAGMLYTDNTTTSVFSAKAGAEVQPTFNYSGNWMSGYVYVDWNNDGRFDYEVNADGTPAEGSEIVSYSAAKIDTIWYKSDGTTRGDGNGIGNGAGVPKFTVPAGTKPGFYRMRYKVDWNSLNPAGASEIIENGGGYIDVMLDVQGDEVTVSASQRNGYILLPDDSELNSYKTNYGETLKVKLAPAPGFVQYGFLLKYGYNIDAPTQLDDNNNPNWIEVSVPYNAINGDGTYNIPAEYMRGSSVSLEGDMQQEQLYTVKVVGLEGQGGVVYANIETPDGGKVYATQFFTAEQASAIPVENYDGTVTVADRVITVTYALSGAPCTPITSLADLKNYKLYHIAAKSGEGYLAWNSSITEEYVSLRGVTNSSYNGLPGDKTIAGIYQEEVSRFDNTVVWQIILEEGKYYLYQPEKKAYVTRSGRNYKFTNEKTALDGIKANGDGTFAIHAGGSYSDGSTNFACICTNEPTNAVRNWTATSHGAALQIIENPNVYTLEYTVEVTGNANGGITLDGANYANGATVKSTEFLTGTDVTAKKVGMYSSEVTVDKENAKIKVVYTAPKVVTAINPEMYYTLECRSAENHNTTRFIGDNGTVINGRSAEPTFLMFEPGETDGTYYIKSVVSGKYLNSDGSKVTASTTKTTAWTFGVGGRDNVANVVTFSHSTNMYLNNSNTKSDGTCNYLQPKEHNDGGPKNDNACSLWEMCEFEPEYNKYPVSIFGDDAATVTYDGKQYANGATISTFDFIKEADLTVPSVEGKITVVYMDGNNIYVSYFANDTRFYTMKNGKGGYVSLAEGYTEDGNLLLNNTNPAKDKKGLWAFVGNATDGYTVYNYTTGLAKVLGMTGSEAGARATMVVPGTEGYATTFEGTFDFNGDASYIKSKGTNDWWNNRNDYLAYWNTSSVTGDQGSKFFLSEADLTLYPDEYIHEITDIKGVDAYSPKNPNTLWYTTSAEATGVSYPWMEYALPLGNGELGCMVFGGVAHEELQFNEKTLWSGPANTVGAGSRTFMNFGSLIIANNDASIYTEGVTDYVRYLDIEEGIAGVEFKNANGTKQTRKYLSSAPDQVIAAQYKVTEGTDKLNLMFTLEPGNSINASSVTYENGTASFSGAMTVKYAARLHVKADEGATITTGNSGIKVENATEVTFYLKGVTNFNGDMEVLDNYFTDETVEQLDSKASEAIETAAAKGFEAVEAAHVADFTAITKRMTFDLGLQTPTVDTKTLVDNYYPNNGNADSKQNDHLFLEQLYFHFGRYLAISSNRKPIAAPNNLQGIWNDRGTDSPWNSDIHTNINIQMNYWPTEITNLSDLHKPFVNFIIRGAQSAGWKEVANRYNDGHGWSVLTETSLYNSMSTWGNNYLVANVWYTSHLWMHWKYTQDKEFLKKAFPVMWDCAKFWFHRLIEDRGEATYGFEPDGTFVAPNEYSAEQNDHPSEDGTAHAQQMISYLFENISEAIAILGADELGLTAADIEKLNLYLEKTDKGLHTEEYTGKWGDYNGVTNGDLLLREWKYAPYSVSNDRGHRHMSHMMALFPLDQITPESEYFTPAVNSLLLRGDAATGWSMGWKVNLWARAQDGDHAHLIIKNALKHSTTYGTDQGQGGIYYNLFDSHAPFQIDGNFGVCSGIAEMLLQSAHGYINILPAMPAAWEDKGTVTGMKAMGNFTVGFNWADGKAQQATIVSNAGAALRVRCDRGAMNIAKAKVTVNGSEVSVIANDNGTVTIPCAKNDVVVIDFTAETSMPATSSVAVNIGEHEIATFYANEAVTIADGVKAYVATQAPEMEEGTITMTEIADGIIPAQTGAVLRGEAGDYTFDYTAQTGNTNTTGNMLVGYAGTAESQQVALPDDATLYVLTVKDENAGFYRKDKAFKVYNHKAYLQVPGAYVESASAPALTIRFDGDGTTGIENAELSIFNSQLSIFYDLQGRRVVNPAKGVYIVNGKKVIK